MDKDTFTHNGSNDAVCRKAYIIQTRTSFRGIDLLYFTEVTKISQWPHSGLGEIHHAFRRSLNSGQILYNVLAYYMAR